MACRPAPSARMPIFGALFTCLAAAGLIAGAPRDAVIGIGAMAVLMLMGIGRQFGTAVRRTPTEVVCRFAPLLEGNTYLPLLLVGFFLAYDTGHRTTGWARLVTPLVALLGLFAVAGAVRMRRRCRLCIGPSALSVSVTKSGVAPIVIPRESIETITTVTVSPGSGRTYAPQTEIVYRPDDSEAPAIIQIGPKLSSPASGLQLTVRQLCLNQALTAWKDGSAEDPELLDRVESLLRGAEAEETSWL